MIRAFTNADLDAAAELPAARDTRQRETEQLLPDDVGFRAQVESERVVDGAGGAIRDTSGSGAFQSEVEVRRGMSSDLDVAWRLDGELRNAIAPSPRFSSVRVQSEQPRVPKDSIDLANAATFPGARGLGAARALTQHALAWSHDNGYRSMTIDWRLTNLLASRFWPKRGFRPTFLRLPRHVA